MATLNHKLDLQPEQICYVQCGYCTTILLVSVPSSSLSMIVTVRCGHCSSLLPVDMKKSSFVPLHDFTSEYHDHCLDQEEPKQQVSLEKHVAEVDEHQEKKQALANKSLNMHASHEEEEQSDQPTIYQITNNKPPEKRRRAPSVYNQFIKEEIKRLKVTNPNMTHKQAFSSASKNWAHFPVTQPMREEDDANDQGVSKMTRHPNIEEVHFQGNGFNEGNYSNHSIDY